MKRNSTQRTSQQQFNLYNRLHKIFAAIWLCLVLLNCVFFIVLYVLGVISFNWFLMVIVALSVVIIVAAAFKKLIATNVFWIIVSNVYISQLSIYVTTGESPLWFKVAIIVLEIIMFVVYLFVILLIAIGNSLSIISEFSPAPHRA